MSNFARLEVVEGRQILAELINEEDELKIRLRRDYEVVLEMKIGAWSDDDAGWGAAETALMKLDLTKSAAKLDAMFETISSRFCASQPGD